MSRSLRQLGKLTALSGACLIGVLSLSAQAQNSGYTPPHVDVSAGNMQPPYPPSAMTDAEQGTVVVGVLVTGDGKARHPSLDRSSGFDDLDNAAIQAVLNWKFVPAMMNGVPQDGRTDVAINFQLPNVPQAMSPKSMTSSH